MEILQRERNAIIKMGQSIRRDMAKHPRGVTNYKLVMLDKNGKLRPSDRMSSACISGLISLRNSTYDTPLVCINSLVVLNEQESTKVMRVAWMEWVMNESPWRHAFIYKDKFNPKLNYSVATRCDMQANYFSTPNNIARIGVENIEPLKLWWSLVQAGVNKNFAVCLSGLINTKVVDGDVVINDYGKQYFHSTFRSTTTERFCKVLAGKKLHNELYDTGLYKDIKTYNGAVAALYEYGDNTDWLYSGIEGGVFKDVVVKAKVDLMGRKKGTDLVGKRATVEQLNKFWSDYVQSPN